MRAFHLSMCLVRDYLECGGLTDFGATARSNVEQNGFPNHLF